MPVDFVRDSAIQVLIRVLENGAFISVALDKTLKRKPISDRGRRFLTQLVYGVTRHRLLCDFVLSKRLKQPIEQLPFPIRIILEMGVFQSLFCSQVTTPAMVHTSVDLAKKWGHAGTARLVNAVLHTMPRNVDEIRFPNIEKYPVWYLSVRYSLPQWLITSWVDEFGFERAEELCNVSTSEAPTTIRVNTLKFTVDDLQVELNKSGFAAEKRTIIPEELTLTDGIPPARHALFSAGTFIIQDAASMLPVHLLEPQPGESILDMCAAPGGKSTHILQLTNAEARVVAMDFLFHKLELIRDNQERLDFPPLQVLNADGHKLPFKENCFDRVLVDSPCSCFGTLRRHPELKWRLKESDPQECSTYQIDLLRSAVKVCKNGGIIVYSVCTFSPAETQDVLQAIMNDGHVSLEDGPEWMAPWKIGTGTYRVLPQEKGLDGFFLMRLRKAY